MIKHFLIIILLILISACSPESSLLKVSLILKEDITGEWVWLQEVQEVGLVTIDSAELSAGTAVFFIQPVTSEFYRLDVFGRKNINLIVGPQDEKKVFIRTSIKSNKRIKVEGSIQTSLMISMDSTVRKRQSDMQLLNQEAIQARSQGDVNTFNAILNQFNYLNKRHDDHLKDQIRAATPQLAGIYGLNYIDIEANFSFFDSLATIYQIALSDHVFTLDLLSKVNSFRSLAVGGSAPEISLPDTSGSIFNLSSLQGNYVLIDFWAAWCRPCRLENPNVVRLYNKYRNENFEILGVSLDRTDRAWRKAIADDGLEWIHVSDLSYFNTKAAKDYQVSSIPQTFLIDPQGKIVAKGLRGPSLEAKLSELFD
ncbi:MAG: cytochrome C biogenesis protein [Flammeovirgaceae bacterium]|nr:cytochrome C biogenesis protein [Flammeovirgaceae bacterium]|tara:strand:+ start:1755 stop:2858 length:1104 start_codon:yes stop_codon:yes gene_type:complete